MGKSHRQKSLKKNYLSLSKTKLMILTLIIASVAAAIFLVAPRASNKAYASPAIQKRYKATRPIVVDKQTGQRRMPTQEEIDQTVANLKVLADRPENLQQTTTANGAVGVDLQGGYGGVMLARPDESGGWETRCVFTFEEGAEFLGLVEVNSAE